MEKFSMKEVLKKKFGDSKKVSKKSKSKSKSKNKNYKVKVVDGVKYMTLD